MRRRCEDKHRMCIHGLRMRCPKLNDYGYLFTLKVCADDEAGSVNRSRDRRLRDIYYVTRE